MYVVDMKQAKRLPRIAVGHEAQEHPVRKPSPEVADDAVKDARQCGSKIATHREQHVAPQILSLSLLSFA